MVPIVAVDGPAGAGKSTLALRLALELGLPYLNTGLMYRAVAALALREGVDVEDGRALAHLTRRFRFSLAPTRPWSLQIDGAAPSPDLTSDAVEEVVSRVARHPEVREILRDEQRRLGAEGAVVEGRDIGSVVFPTADAKIFLVAAPEERAARRSAERGEGAGGIADALHVRDRQDARVNPLRPASDAVLVDTSGRGPDEVFVEAIGLVRARLGGRR